MAKPTPVEIPVFNVNDETVILSAWLVKDGDEVLEGQNLAEVETSKALVELMAPASGSVRITCRPGTELHVGTIVAYIGNNGSSEESAQPDITTQSVSRDSAATPPADAALGTRFSRKAKELLQLHGVPAGAFTNYAMVREEDVLNYLHQTAASFRFDPANLHHALAGISLDGVTFPRVLSERQGGSVAPEFFEEIRNHSNAFLKLSSEEKCKLYREHGAEIGEDVQIGKGTLIVAPCIQIGDRVRFGENSNIQLRERFAVERLSSFREGLTVRGGTAVFGSNTYAGSRIQIGGGGNADPWAVLVVGDGVYLGDDLFINICRPVLIGREVFLTQRSILVTHNIGHSILEGYENAFAPIVLEDFSQVGMNSTLYAGSRVGHSAILGSNSFLVSSVPKGKLAMGVPAAVVRDAARSISRNKQVQIAASMLRQFWELLKLKGVPLCELAENPILHFTLKHGGRIFRIGFIESLSLLCETLDPADELVIWTLDSSGAPMLPGSTVMDLLAKTCSGPRGLFADSAREFLRKRGIRLEPGPWRYQNGLI